MEFDLIVKGGTVATAADTFEADVGGNGGKPIHIPAARGRAPGPDEQQRILERAFARKGQS